MDLNIIETAVEFLSDGQSFTVGRLRLGMNGKTNVYVTGLSQYSDVSSLTKSHALKELKDIKTLFKQMVELSGVLNDFIKGKSIKYNLAFNYGMGAHGICSEADEIILWHLDIK